MIRQSVLVSLFCAAAAAQTALPPAVSRPVDFTRDVEPVFRTRCSGCHGAKQQISGLRLDQAAAAMAGGYSGAVIKPGKSAESALIQRVAGSGKLAVMPPTGARLTAEEIGALRSWIDQGAKWPEAAANSSAAANSRLSHWAFQIPARPSVPAVRKAGWARNPIDQFILARLEKEGLPPSPEASRTTLLRRVSLDLTGLPPTPAEIDAFVNDTRPDAYARVLDRLFQSPHYGEKWARHWLDLARYADSDGYEKDLPRPYAWRYRHWLIDTLNRDLPFDEFTKWTIAGDLYPNATLDQRLATGFHRNTLTNREGGTEPEQFRYEQNLDRTGNVGTVWLGLTVGCAQCHDHKYDPTTQRDHYRMFAFFNQTEEVNLDAPLPGEAGPYFSSLPRYQRRRAELFAQYNVDQFQAEWEQGIRKALDKPGESHEWDFWANVFRVMTDDGVRILRMKPEERTPKQKDVITSHFIENYAGLLSKERAEELRWKELREKVKLLDESMPSYSQGPALAERRVAPKSHIHIRGEFDRLGVEVAPGAPAFLFPEGKPAPRNRMEFANWLVSTDNPLTARVTVNRMWQELFGRGLVRTSEDFGLQGERPSHPELLDWLAVEFREQGWSMKRMHRLIVESATYRQSSQVRPEVRQHDPANILLAAQSRLRLPAELIRDQALAASGLLNTSIGGRSMRPPQPDGLTNLQYGGGKWTESTGPERYRRGLYVHFQRTVPYPQLMTFDAPDSNVTCSRRQRSNTPLQALNLLNDPVFFEAAQGLAERMLSDIGGSAADRVDYGIRLTIGRPASAAEKDRLSGYFEKQKQILRSEPNSVAALFPARIEGVDPVEAAAWVGVGRVMLNLDEFINRE